MIFNILFIVYSIHTSTMYSKSVLPVIIRIRTSLLNTIYSKFKELYCTKLKYIRIRGRNSYIWQYRLGVTIYYNLVTPYQKNWRNTSLLTKVKNQSKTSQNSKQMMRWDNEGSQCKMINSVARIKRSTLYLTHVFIVWVSTQYSFFFVI